MENIQVRNITLMEKVETLEAKEYYHKSKLKNCWFYIIPALLCVLFLILTILKAQEIERIVAKSVIYEERDFVDLMIFICLMFVFFVSTIFGFIIYCCKIKPYRQLLVVAKFNDKIRHEEKIRYNERKRLEMGQKSVYTVKDVSETVMEQTQIK